MKRIIKGISLLLTTILMMNVIGNLEVKAQEINHLTKTEEEKIEKIIEENMSEGKIPGLSVTIVKDNETVYQKGFGYAHIDKKELVTSQSLFELASNSKAFTALALLKLEKSGKINLNDEVTTYIPWLKVNYKGREMPITIEQTLHQTTGIPPWTINMIPVSNADNALEETVRTLIGIELDSKPGEMFQYATINYDILGLIIEKVTGKSFENYMNEEILKPLGLKNTYLFRDDAINDRIVGGYKIGFFKPRLYDAPIYRGNKPAGYLISSGEDMGNWLKIQMGTMDELNFDHEAIKKTHQASSAVDALGNEVLYAGGWFLESKEQITHDGMNPNYSSYVTFNDKEKIGIAVLGNLSSTLVQKIGIEINGVLQKGIETIAIEDSNQYLDKLAVWIMLFLTLVGLIFSLLIIKTLIGIFKGRLHFKYNGIKSGIKLGLSLLLMLGLSYFIYLIPNILLSGFTWGTVFVWSPSSIQMALYSLYVVIWCIYIFFILKGSFKKE